MSYADDEDIDSTTDDDDSVDDTDDSTDDSTDDDSTDDDSTDDDSTDDDSTDDDSTDDEPTELEKLKDQNIKLFERAKKAEGFVKVDGDWVKKSKPATKKPKAKEATSELTPLDTIALMGAKVTNVDDINEVMDYAKLKNISVSDALKSNVVKTILADKVEERETANATATKRGKRGVHKPSDETVLSNAGEGKFPEDPKELAKARTAQKKKKKSE